MSERLERVTDWSELRAGMIVVVKPLRFCSCGSHRAMLMPPRSDGPIYTNGRSTILPAGTPRYELSPKPRCSTAIYSTVTQDLVASRQLWRVLDGLEEPSTETAAASPKETVDVLD